MHLTILQGFQRLKTFYKRKTLKCPLKREPITSIERRLLNIFNRQTSSKISPIERRSSTCYLRVISKLKISLPNIRASGSYGAYSFLFCFVWECSLVTTVGKISMGAESLEIEWEFALRLLTANLVVHIVLLTSTYSG